MDSAYPTDRPTDATLLDDEPPDLPDGLSNQPWIDAHNHAHTLSWEDRERFALAGCRAMVMVASGIHWTPYRPVEAGDVRYLWDDAINRLAAIRRNHFFDARLAVGVQTGIRVEEPDPLLDAMDRYCGLEEVVAVGETGVTPSQHADAWSLDEQVDVVRAQMEIADRHDLPVILHTPNPADGSPSPYRPGFDQPGYEKNTSLATEPVIDAEDAALEAVRRDVEAAAEAGLPEERIVASHADPNNVAYLMEETDCLVSFTIGQPWMTGVSAATVADAVERYGPDRITVETDAANVLRSDVLSIKRAVLELYRRGIDEDAIRRVVLENPSEAFSLPS